MVKRKSEHVSSKEFVRFWASSNTLEEVAEKCKCSVGAVRQRARSYLKEGVKLKKLSSKPRLPVDELNALIKEIESGVDGFEGE